MFGGDPVIHKGTGALANYITIQLNSFRAFVTDPHLLVRTDAARPYRQRFLSVMANANGNESGTLVPEPLLEQAARRFKMLSEPVRLQILNHLHAYGELHVQQIADATGQSQANVSKHLGLLYRENLVARRKEGLFAYYMIADPMLSDICTAVCENIDP